MRPVREALRDGVCPACGDQVDRLTTAADPAPDSTAYATVAFHRPDRMCVVEIAHSAPKGKAGYQVVVPDVEVSPFPSSGPLDLLITGVLFSMTVAMIVLAVVNILVAVTR